MWNKVQVVKKAFENGSWNVVLQFDNDMGITPRNLPFTGEPPLTDELLAQFAQIGFDKLNAETQADTSTIKAAEPFDPAPILAQAVKVRDAAAAEKKAADDAAAAQAQQEMPAVAPAP